MDYFEQIVDVDTVVSGVVGLFEQSGEGFGFEFWDGDVVAFEEILVQSKYEFNSWDTDMVYYRGEEILDIVSKRKNFEVQFGSRCTEVGYSVHY